MVFQLVYVWFWGFLQELAQQIKVYQAKINEISEKSHYLAERSADLGPLCARKLYHTGDRETRVLDLVNTLNEPLEPYVSPLASPRSPEHSIKYQYQNPLKLFKDGLGPFETSSAGQDVTDTTLNGMDKPSPRGWSEKTLPSSSLQFANTRPERIKPEVDLKNRSSPNLSKTDPSVTLATSSSHLPGVKVSRSSPQSSRKHIGDSDTTHYDSGVIVSSPASRSSARSLSEGRQPFSDSSFVASEAMELSIEVPRTYGMPPKRGHSSDRDSKGQPKSKSLRSSNDMSEIGSVKSGSTEGPTSAASGIIDFEVEDTVSQTTNTVKASLPSSQTNQILPSDASADNAGKVADIKDEIPEEMLLLKQRKAEALVPYKPRSKYLSSKLGHVETGDSPDEEEKKTYALLAKYLDNPSHGHGADANQKDKPWKIKGDRTPSSKGPVKGEHSVVVAPECGPNNLPERESRLQYKPRSPSPLTLPSTSRSQASRSGSAEGNSLRAKSMDRIRGHRSLSPNTEDRQNFRSREKYDPLSKSLTSAQIRSMGSKGSTNKDRLGISNNGAWDTVGVFAIIDYYKPFCRGDFKNFYLADTAKLMLIY